MVTEIWLDMGSGNGLLPHGTKPLPAPMLIIISEILRHLPKVNFTWNAQEILPRYEFENC